MARLNHKGEYWDHLDLVELFRDVANVRNVGTIVNAVSVGGTAFTLNGVAPVVVGTLVRVNVRDRLELQQAQTVTTPGVASTGTLSVPLNPANTETVVIGPTGLEQTYTFVTALTAGGGLPGEILIGASNTDSIDNLVAAINGAAGAGTLYGTGTPINQDVSVVRSVNDMNTTAKYIGAAGDSVNTTETLAGAGNQWAAATLTGGVNAVGTMRFPYAYAHAAGIESASQTAFDLGNILDAGVRVTFSGDHNPVNAATKRLVTAYLTGHAEIMSEFELLGFALENLAVALGQNESDVVGSGTSAAPDTIAITADDFNTDNDLSWRFTGATKDGQIVLLDLWATENDFSAVNFAMQRGTPAPVPVRAKSTSGLRVSKYVSP